MKRAIVLGGCLLAAAFCSWSLLAQRGASAAAQEVATLTKRTAAATAAAGDIRQRLKEVEADTTQRLDQIATLSSAWRQTQRSPSNEVIRERHTRARESAERGAWQEALADYVWCYDYAFLRSPALIKNFAQLGKSYPPAAAELQVRLQAAEARARHDPTATEALQDFITLDRALNQSARTLAFYDELPVTDERRPQLARALVQEFIALQRYRDVSAVVPKFESTIQQLEGRLKLQGEGARANQAPPQNEPQRIAAERARAAQLRAAVDSATLTMEVLAGLGDSDRAHIIAEKILVLDTSPEARAVVTSKLARAAMTEPRRLPPANTTSP